MRGRAKLGAIVAFCALSLGPVWGAQAGGRIAGRVTDPNGAAVSGATVILRNVAMETERATETDQSGQYEFAGGSIGIYRLRVQKAGFSDAARRIEIAEPGESHEVHFELVASGIVEQVTVTATRGERDTLSVPVRAQSLDETVLFRQNPATTGDALLGVPNLTPVNSGPYLVRPRLRGFDSTRLLVLVDGERLNNSRTSTGAAGVEIGLIDPSAIEAVEVVHGAGSALYGTDALSGTINITTQTPHKVDQAIRLGGSFTGYYSSNENGRRGSASVDVSGRWFAARFSGMLERFPSYSAGRPFNESSVPLIQAGTIRHAHFGPIPDNFNEPFTRPQAVVPNSQEHGSNLNLVSRVFLSQSQSLKLNLIRRRAADIGFPDFAPPYFFQVINLPASNLDKASLRYEGTAFNSWFSRLAVGTYWQHQDRRLFNDFFVLGLSPPGPNDLPFANVSRVDIVSNTGQNVKSIGYDVQANFLLGTSNIITAGTSLFRDHSRDFRQTVTDVTLIGLLSWPDQTRFFPRNFPIVRDFVGRDPRVPISNFQDAAGFVQDEHELSPAWRLIGSFRFDRFDIDTQQTPGYNPRPPDLANANPPIDLSTVPPVDGIRFNRTSVTGDFGVVYRPTASVSINGRIGRSFRHPNLSELFFSGPAESGVLVPNIALVPERGINVDVGVKLRTARLSGAVTYFHNWYKDFLSREEVSFSSQAGGVIYQALNFSRVRMQGVEADWEMPIQAPESAFSFFGDFSYLWGQIEEGLNPLTGQKLEKAPADDITPVKMVAGLRWSDRVNRFWGEYAARIQTHVNRVSPLLYQSPLLEPQDLWNLFGFTVHGLRGGFNAARGEHAKLSVTIGVENVGNKFYREQFQFAPARGRSFTVGINVKHF